MGHVESPAARPQVDARIRAALGGLRRRIRVYVWLQGLAAIVVWLGLTFWAGFALDYLPVLLGANEMPRAARAVLLVLIALGVGYVVYRWLLTRLLVPLGDRSLALLLERRHRNFRDSLVTTVELTDPSDDFDPLTRDMLAATGRQAVDELRSARPSQVFNAVPLLRMGSFAGLLILLILGGFAVNAGAMTKAAKRIYLLDNELWERFARVEVVGIEVRRPVVDASLGANEQTSGVQSLAFTQGSVKVARGANITLLVEADATAHVLPEQCYLNYRTDEGDRGTVTMKRVGRPKNNRQTYLCDAKPLAGILNSLDFDVLGYDHRREGFRLEVVDSPAVVGAQMDLRYPSYMGAKRKTVYQPRQGEPVELGTHVTLKFAASKPLQSAEIRLVDPQASDSASIELERKVLPLAAGATSFAYEIPSLMASRVIEVSLLDADGVTSERAFRMFLTATPDEAPRWELALRGIGAAVTPDVILPLSGKVTDDHGVDSQWLATTIGELDPVRFDIARGKTSEFTFSIDFREQRTQRESFRLDPGQKLAIEGRALDRFDLGAAAHEGTSERYVLDVVTPDELLVTLEARELALRRRYEVIVEEMTAMRDSLLRIRPAEQATVASIDPEDSGETQLSPEEQARRAAELRVLRVQRAIQQSSKSSQEISGVAQAFDGIREELTNNRVDTEDRKSRLKEQIADPLHAIVKDDFPQLNDLLLTLEPLASDAEQGPPAVAAALTHTNEVLAKLDQVLQKMLKLETYNEIVDIVRDLIKEQNALIDDTKRQQRRDLLED